jgi:pSer/pThr/pTyr-binding forkhead associated (FHA) protein
MSAELKGSQGAIPLNLPTSGIGRDPANQLVINDSEVSWHHAQIVQQGQGHHILDLGSRNGTFVNGQRLLLNVPRSLRDGDTIRFGNTTAFIYTNESLRYTPTKLATLPSTPPPPPFSPPLSGISSPAYKVASFQQQSPPATLPIEPKKEAKSETPRWVTIVGGLASIATIFGLIFTIYTATNPSSTPTPTPGPPSNSPVPSIPQLHSSYQGMFTHTDNSGLPT